MPFSPINLGNIIQQGEAIQGSRLQNLRLSQAMDPNSPTNQLMQLQIESRRLENEAMRNPAQIGGFEPVEGLDGYVAQRGPRGQYSNITNTTPDAPSYHFGTTGVAGDPNLRQTVAVNQSTLEATPYGDPYQQRAQVEINNGGGTEPQAPDPTNPAPTVPAPWDNITDPKVRANAQLKFGENADKEISKLQSDSADLFKMADRLERFTYLNKTNETGGIVGSAVVGAARKPFDAEFAEMSAIVDEVTPQMRQGLPGAASERDTAMFRGATVGTSKPLATNQNINTAIQVAAQNKKDHISFFENFRLNNGHLIGAKKEWRKYLEANPIFDHKAEKGSYKLNNGRQTWVEYFGGDSPAAPDLTNLSDGELDAYIQQLQGAK